MAQFERLDAAFRSGDLAALRAAGDDPAVIPNGPMPIGIGRCLDYAIYHSPVPFIRSLLALGPEPKPVDHAGFPPLLAALSKTRGHPGGPARCDVIEIVELLLSFGADPNQRGINGYTARHMAVAVENLTAVELLLRAGADPGRRTGIDDDETPRGLAARAGGRRP